MKYLASLFLISFLFFSCTTAKLSSINEAEFSETSRSQLTSENDDFSAQNQLSSQNQDDEIARIMEKMTLKEKICQLFVVRLQSLDQTQTAKDIAGKNKRGITAITEEIAGFYEEYPCGGVILYASEIGNPLQLKELTSKLHDLKSPESRISPFVYIDEEGGRVARLANSQNFHLPKYKNMASVAETADEENAHKAGQTIGKYLKEYGIDVDFAPVADVNTNPDNPIIGRRAFGSNPETAAKMAVAFYNGLSENGIYGCFKHFPGHGDTKTDTHSGYAKTDKTWQELLNCEIIPFEAGIKNNVQFIMTAHITAPQVDAKKVPSTLSKTILTDKLRGELGYNGIIITDGMEMGAITKNYNPQKAALKALLAGADIILCPSDYKKSADTIFKAVKSRRISEERINESVRRILMVKMTKK